MHQKTSEIVTSLADYTIIRLFTRNSHDRSEKDLQALTKHLTKKLVCANRAQEKYSGGMMNKHSWPYVLSFMAALIVSTVSGSASAETLGVAEPWQLGFQTPVVLPLGQQGVIRCAIQTA